MQIKMTDGSTMDADTGIITPGIPSPDEVIEPKGLTLTEALRKVKVTAPTSISISKEIAMKNEPVVTMSETNSLTINKTYIHPVPPLDSVTRDCDGHAEAFGLDKALMYGLLRGLSALNKVVESPAPREPGARGKNKVLYSMSPSVAAFLLNQ